MQIVLIEGDGIGPEVTQAACRVVAAAGVKVDWVKAAAGIPAAAQFGEPLPEETLDIIRRYRVALKGPCTTPVGKGFRSINVRLRQGLDLYASVRPVNTLPGVKTPYEKVDLVVVRENTEGLYAGLEHEVVPGVVESVRLITRPAAERIVRFAFELARHRGRQLVTFCHKADVMRLSDGLFLECARTVADDYPFIQFEEKPIDNVCLELAMDPTRYDVLVMENLFGDVISDLAAGLIGGAGPGGGLGLVPGANLGTRYAVFEAVHGQRPGHRRQGAGEPDRGDPQRRDDAGARRPAGEAGQRIERSVHQDAPGGRGPHPRPGRRRHHRDHHRADHQEPGGVNEGQVSNSISSKSRRPSITRNTSIPSATGMNATR